MPLDGQSSLLPLHGRPQAITDAIAAIAEVSDPVVQNLQITQIYHDLAIALADHYGSRDITWCGFAKWTSASAGRLLRGRALHSVIHSRLEGFVRNRLRRSRGLLGRFLGRVHPHIDPLLDCVQAVDRQVRNEVARGNVLVFTELAPRFAALLVALREAKQPNDNARKALLAGLDPRPVERGGQQLLIEAFATYYDLSFEHDDKLRAERMLYANLLVARHEQTRLQAVIERAYQAPNAQLQAVATKGIGSQMFADIVHARFGRMLEQLVRKQLTTLELPNLSVDLGEDVPPLFNGEMFPRSLKHLSDPQLIALIEQLDRDPTTTAGSAALDWAAICDRMNFVVDLYRSRQQDLALYRAPFCLGQVAAIRRGELPGDLY